MMICPECKGKRVCESDIIPGKWIDARCSTCKGTGEYIDPYLVPGQICEVWDNDETHKLSRSLRRFYKYDNNNIPLFECPLHVALNNKKYSYNYYHPVGTEWKFAPPWVKCIVVTDGGLNVFFSIIEIEPYYDSWAPKKGHEKVKYQTMICGICPDKSRYENGAWKTSLRERPFWAKGGNDG